MRGARKVPKLEVPMSILEQAKQAVQDGPPPSPRRKLGRWGRLFLNSLAKNDPDQEKELKEAGELQKVAASIDELAATEFAQTMEAEMARMSKEEPELDEAAKVTRARQRAEELVTSSVVVPDPKWMEQNRDGYTDENTADWDDEPFLPKVPPPTST